VQKNKEKYLKTKKKTTKSKSSDTSSLREAQNLDWNDLACAIIYLEKSLRLEKNAKKIDGLNKKLEIFEEEKKSRVLELFSMERFLNRDFNYLYSADFEDSDV